MASFQLLQGYRVIDLSSMLAGPYCSYQLALLGADVTKVEAPPDGDLARLFGADPQLGKVRRGASFLAQNAGKKSIVLNLKEEADKVRLRGMIAQADVLLENYRPGVLERLGFGLEELKKIKPDLVYCAISGFGATGELAQRPAYEQIIQGYSGIMDITGFPEGGPVLAGFPICDILGGLNAAFAIAAALAGRRQEQEMAFIDVSLMESSVSALAWAVSNYLIADKPPSRIGNTNFAASPSGLFNAGEGKINISANKQSQYEALCEAIGREDLKVHPDFALREDRIRNREALVVEIEAALASKSAQEWEHVLNLAGVPAGRVMSVPEILAHPHMVEREFLQEFKEFPTPAGRPLSVVRGGFLVNGEAPKANSPPPDLDQQRTEVLRAFGLAKD